MRRTHAIEELKAKSLGEKEPLRLETENEYFAFLRGKLVAYQFKIHAPAPAR